MNGWLVQTVGSRCREWGGEGSEVGKTGWEAEKESRFGGVVGGV